MIFPTGSAVPFGTAAWHESGVKVSEKQVKR